MGIFAIILAALVIGYWNYRINHQKFHNRMGFYNKALAQYAAGELADDTVKMLRTINMVRNSLGVYEQEQLDYTLGRCGVEV